MTTSSRLAPLCIIAIGLLLAVVTSAAAETFQIQAVAYPSRLVYAADNTVTLTVSVTDGTGNPAPDGTPVYFHTTLGTLPTLAYTQQGRVSVMLSNTTGAGIAVITVTVSGSRQTLNVEYLGQGAATAAPMKRIKYRLKAQQVYYSVDKQIFDLRDQAQFITPTFTVVASAMQYDITTGILCAQEGVTLTTGKHTLAAKNLRFTVGQGQGTVIVVDPDIAYKTVTLPDLTVKDDTEQHDIDYYRPLNTLPTHTWIVCRDVTVFPNEQIQFRHPHFYLDSFSHEIYSLPYHVMNMRSTATGTLFNSEIRFTTDAGLNVDFPIYYVANDSHVGSLHLRNVTKGSSFFQGSTGLEMSIEQEYLLGQSADGGLYLDNLTSPTRSASWEHRQDFANTHLNLGMSYERYAENTPYTKRVMMGLAHQMGPVGMNLNTNWSGFGDNQDGLAELGFRFPALPLGHTGFNLSFAPYLGYDYTRLAATALAPTSNDESFYQGVRTSLGIPQVRFLGGTISTNVSNELSHDSKDIITNYLDAGVNYQRRLSKMFSTSLNYTYGLAHSSNNQTASRPNQRLSMNLVGRSGRSWSLYTYSTYNIDSQALYHTINSTYNLPWFLKRNREPRCYLQYRASLNNGATTLGADQLFSLGINLGSFDLIGHYSPTSNNAVTGLGSGTGKKWAVELVRSAW